MYTQVCVKYSFENQQEESFLITLTGLFYVSFHFWPFRGNIDAFLLVFSGL